MQRRELVNAIASNRRGFVQNRSHRSVRSRRISSARHAAWYEWLALVLVVLLLTYAALTWARPHTGSPHERTATVHVGGGDTLWSLARTHPTPGLTTAQNVELIRAINGRSGGAIHAGEVLLVPSGTEQGLMAAR